MKKRKTLILMLSLVCLLVVGIGFAAITHDFTITGTAKVVKSNFDVNFVTNGTEPYTVSSDGKTATVTVSSGLAAVGTSVTVKVKIENASTDYDANITAITVGDVTISGTETKSTDISVTTTNAPITVDAKSDDTNGSEIIDVIFTVNKAQTEDTTFAFTISFTATAVPVAA